MYCEHYGLSETPFRMTPDPRFFFRSTGHGRALSHLVYGLSQREGFIVVTGEVGSGKTTLVERLCADLPQSTYAIGRVVTTQVSQDDLLRLVASTLGVDADGDKATVLRRIADTLQTGDGRHRVLIVDEAQSLPVSALEELRMLSNVTDGRRALLQTVLLGQPEFRSTLASPELDQLRQRVLACYHLGPLNCDESHAYIEHRLRAAGWAGNPAWDRAATSLVHQHTDGVPRRINRLCSRVLLYGALEGSTAITPSIVEATAEELQEDLGGDQGPGAGFPSFPKDVAASLERRLDYLEDTVMRRERVFRRLADLFDNHRGPAR